MVLSMTGYAQITGTVKNKSVFIEIKSLNGKMTDIRMKIPNSMKEKEIQLRKMILNEMARGKIDVSITLDSDDGDSEYSLNTGLFSKYFLELNQLQESLDMPKGDYIQAILRIPNVICSKEIALSEKEWNYVLGLVLEVLKKLKTFRAKEGKALENDLRIRIENIQDKLTKIEVFEKERIGMIKDKMSRNLNENFKLDNIDKNRYEQEVIYYLEKLDITEEKVRLSQHCKYFNQELAPETDDVKGKKLGFISQEIGREINTLGAKAQHSEIQRLVVQMKDELEKIKEQVANIV